MGLLCHSLHAKSGSSCRPLPFQPAVIITLTDSPTLPAFFLVLPAAVSSVTTT
jgi:hypothetical protein